MEKMTQRDYFNELIALATENDRTDLVKFCEGRIAQLDKKTATRKPTKAQVENENLKPVILAILSENENPMTCSQILLDERIEKGTSSQKVSAILKKMVENDKTVEKTVDKRISYFSAVTD